MDVLCSAGDEVTTRVIGVALERDPEHGLGINLRPSGGPQGQLIVTHVKPYGPADRSVVSLKVFLFFNLNKLKSSKNCLFFFV